MLLVIFSEIFTSDSVFFPEDSRNEEIMETDVYGTPKSTCLDTMISISKSLDCILASTDFQESGHKDSSYSDESKDFGSSCCLGKVMYGSPSKLHMEIIPCTNDVSDNCTHPAPPHSNRTLTSKSKKSKATKLADKYNSLYKNERAEALKILSKTVNEKVGTRYLLAIKQHIYSFCNVHRDGRLENPISEGRRQNDTDGCQEDNENKKLFFVKQDYLDMSLNKKPPFADMLPEFVNKCIEICWLMNTRSPPVVFGEPPQAGQPIDRDQYKEYTKQGDVVSFVVWLPLLIEFGAVLSKGVVQPVPYSREKKTATIAEQLNTRSRRGTQNERNQRLPHDTGDIQDNGKNPPDGKPERTKPNSSFEQRVSDLRNENDQNKKILAEQPMQVNKDHSTFVDAQVDEFFEKTRTGTYSHSIAPVTSASSVTSHNAYNTCVTTYSGTQISFQPKTTNNYSATTSTTNVNDRPHTAYFEQKRDTKDYSKQPAKSAGVRSSGDTNTTAYLDPALTEYYSDGRHTYAFSDGKVYVKDSRGGWRFKKDLTGESNA